MTFFGGEITEDSAMILADSSIPDNYFLMNFNDLMSSIVTLFALVVVNNWYVIVAMCVDVKSGKTWYRYYFVLFYYFGVIIGLNIVIAFAIDMYAAVCRLENEKNANKDYLLKLAESQHTDILTKTETQEKDAAPDDKSDASRSEASKSGIHLEGDDLSIAETRLM